MTVDDILEILNSSASDKYRDNVVKLGIPREQSIGVSTPELRKLAKKIPKDKVFIMELWETGYHECRILSVLAMQPTDCDGDTLKMMMDDIISWDLCDLFCKTILIKKTDFESYIHSWIKSDSLYYKRAAFALIASTSTHANPTFNDIENYLSEIEVYSDDTRPLIKKAVSWALRELGKINEEAKELSIRTAKRMKNDDSKAKQWVAKDALKELETLIQVSGRSRLISSKSKMGQEALNYN